MNCKQWKLIFILYFVILNIIGDYMNKRVNRILATLLVLTIVGCVVFYFVNKKDEGYQRTVSFGENSSSEMVKATDIRPTHENDISFYLNKNYTHIIFGAVGVVVLVVVLYASTGVIMNNKKKKRLLKEMEMKEKLKEKKH